jgi:hypothetical protein
MEFFSNPTVIGYLIAALVLIVLAATLRKSGDDE